MNDELAETAFHEAGHVVVSMRCTSSEFLRAWIDADGGHTESFAEDDFERVLIAAAGPCAEVLWGLRVSIGADTELEEAIIDVATASKPGWKNDVSVFGCYREKERAIRCAMDFVREEWDLIQLFAEELEKYKVLYEDKALSLKKVVHSQPRNRHSIVHRPCTT
jgi:hypothetical protein